MAVYKRDMVDINLETGNIQRSFLKHSIGYMDQKADHFGVRVFRNGEPVDLTGVSVQGVFMPPQGSPIAITSGNIVSGNEAEVILPQACYNYDGQFTLAIKLVDSSNSVTGTVRIVDGMVDNTHASGTVAPTSAVPTYQEVLSTYEQAIAAINKTVRFDATQSLTDTQKATARSNISSPSVAEMNTAVGNEATARQNADALKVNISDIENDLTGTTAGKVLDARQGKVLDDKVSDLKSAISDNFKVAEDSLLNTVDLMLYVTEIGEISNYGADADNVNYRRSGYIPVSKGTVVNYSLYGKSGANIVSFYSSMDVSGYESGVAGAGATSGKSGTYTMPYSGFVRICVANAKIASCTASVDSSMKAETESIHNDIAFVKTQSNRVPIYGESLFEVEDYATFEQETGAISTGGAEQVNSSYVRSGFIPVVKGAVIRYQNFYCRDSSNILSFYTKADPSTYVSGIAGWGASSGESGTYTMPFSGYMRICCTLAKVSGIHVIVDSKKTEDNRYINGLVEEGLQKLLEYNSDHRCLNFTLITDTHMYPEAPNFSCVNSVRLFAEMSKYTEFSVHCGDVAESGDMRATGLTNDTYVPKALNYDSLGSFVSLVRNTQEPIYICHGNHDVSRYNNDVPGTNAIAEQAWNLQCGKLAKARITNPNDPHSNYYYVDYDEFKCRVIVVDYFAQVDESGTYAGYPNANQGCSAIEKAWLEGTALNLSDKDVPTDWTILMFSHAKQISSLKNKISEIRKSESPIALIFIHGNDHVDDYDNDIYSHSTSTQDDPRYTGSYFNDIGVDKAHLKEWNNSDRGLIGTIDEYCVDVFTIDFEQGKIYETRLGRGSDREYVFSATNTAEANNIVEEEEET